MNIFSILSNDMKIPAKRILWGIVAVYFLLAAFILLQPPYMLHALLFLAFMGVMVARLLYELIWNRGNVPTFPTGTLEARQMIAAIKKHRAEKLARSRSLILVPARGS